MAGLVLGVGATVTLAAWNDSEIAGSAFGAGRFNVQGSTDGTAYADHATAGAAAILTFTFTLRAVGPAGSGWPSTAVSVTFMVTSAAGLVALTC